MHSKVHLPRQLILACILFITVLSTAGLILLHTTRSAHADANDPAHYDNIPGYTLDGLGNTYIINNPKYIHVQDHIDEAVVDASGCVHTTTGWDEGDNTNGVYCNGGVQMYNSSNAPSPVDNTNVNINGGTWTLSNGSVSGPTGTVSGLGKPTALGVDIPDNYLMVADDGVGQHIIKFYDVSGSPTLVRTFGELGGIRAGVPGEVTPTKFWGLTGVGTDSSGNIYVTGSQDGAYIRSFTPDGSTLRWEEDGWLFSDACDFDPASDGQIIYCPRQVFQMDYSKPVGQRWTLKYYTMDLDIYPNDLRATDGNSVWYRVLGGHRYLFRIDMNLWQNFQVYRFENGNYIADPYLDIPMQNLGGNTGDYNVDVNGNIWYTGCNAIYKTPLLGVDGNGNLSYGALQTINIPTPFNCTQKIYYDAPNDTMYLGGGSPSQPTDGWGGGGPVIAKYSNWSTNPQLQWQITAPYYNNEDPNLDARHVQIAYTLAGGYFFVSYVDKDADYVAQDGEAGAMRVYRDGDGSYVGRMVPDGTDGGVQGSWIDVISGGAKAIQRANGDILIVREENWLAKQIIYIWHPGGPPPTPQPTATPTPRSTPTPTPTSTPTTGSLVTAINAGGSATGNFVADTGFDSGNLYSDTSSSIDTSGVSNAAPQGVWQTCRWNSAFTYTITGLTAGASYTIKLDWAELTFQAAGNRQFNVAINGTTKLSNFDVYANAGFKKALQRSFSATANSSGQIAIAFTQGAADNPFVSGIEIYSTSTATPTPTPTHTPTPTPTRTPTPTPTPTHTVGQLVTAINAGGSATGSFVADRGFDSGNLYSDTSSSIDTSGVSNAAPQGVWQTCRWNSAFTYTISGLTAGASYTVKLDWAELTFQAAGNRQFNVAINGTTKLSNFDVNATAGYKKALQKSYTVTANSSGQIVIAFTRGTADNPFINGIEVYTA